MADSIVKLKLESGEYENKIKRATQGLLNMEKECRKAGGTLAIMDKEQQAFVSSLGRMETKTQSAKGKVAELSAAYTDLRAQYNRLTEEEKKGDYGKALNKSLGELRQRIQEGQTELRSIGSEINNNGNLLDQLSSKFGVNIKQLGGWGAALAAGKVALDVMKDAFFASEANLDDWNRAVYAGESAWDAFLTSINTGDIGGFLSKIGSIISAAKEAYNEMDRLSTQKAINNPAVKAQEAENERMRAMLRTGRYISPNDGRQGAMKEGQVLTDAQKQKLAKSLENGMQKLNGFIRSEIEQTTRSIDALYKEQAGRLGMSLGQFRAGTANMDAFDVRIAGYNNYKAYEGRRAAIQAKANSGHNISDAEAAILRGANPYAQYKAWGVFKDDGKLFGQINDYINQRASLQTQNYSNTANAYRAINRATGSGSGSGTGGGTTNKPLTLEFVPKFLTLDEEGKYLADLMKRDAEPLHVDLDLKPGQSVLGALEDVIGYKSDRSGDYDSFENRRNRWMSAKQGADNTTGGKAPNEYLGDISKGIGGMQNVLGSIDNFASTIGLDLGKGFQGLMAGLSVITSILMVIEAIQGAKAVPIIGQFLHGGGVVHAAKGWSGVVPGAANGGRDTVPAMLSPQEVVLNAGQTNNVAAQLRAGYQAGNGGGGSFVSGENIVMGVNNFFNRTGQGEIVTTKMLRRYIG